MFEEIARAFDFGDARPCFAWGDRIYHPFGTEMRLPDELMAHERVHGLRQVMGHSDMEFGIRSWWAQYIDDPEFRLAEELPAHRAELGVHYLRSEGRGVRRTFLTHVASRMIAPLYGYPRKLINLEKAKRMLKAEYGA